MTRSSVVHEKKRVGWKDVFRVLTNILGIFTGAIIYSLAIELFIAPHGFLSGGVAGISLMLFYLTKFSLPILIYAFNIPILIMGARIVGKRFALYSVLGISVMTVTLYLAGNIGLPSITADPMLAAIFGGAISGVGGGIVFRSGGTLGGTDIIAIVLRKKFNLPAGSVIFYINIFIMALSILFFNYDIVMFTLISMLTASALTDRVQTGINTTTTVMIISEKYENIASEIMDKMNRGITFLNAEGGYLHNNKKVIICVVTRFELSRLKDIINRMDKDAFVSISETTEVVGQGF